MSFSVSPAVTVQEIDASLSVIDETSSLGAFAGKFVWGPVGELTLVSDEADLVAKFGAPTNDTYVDFFSIASFFAYTNGAYVVRIGDEMLNAAVPGAPVKIKNVAEFEQANVTANSFVAKYPGQLGNGIDIAVCTKADDYRYDIKDAEGSTEFVLNFGDGTPVRSRVVPFTTGTDDKGSNYLTGGMHGDYLIIDNVRYRVAAVSDVNKTITLDRVYVGSGTPATIVREWAYATQFGVAPAANSIHLVVVDREGILSGEKGAIVETYANLSTVSGTKDSEGNSIFWRGVINTNSEYVYAGEVTPDNTAGTKQVVLSLVGGTDALETIGTDDYISGYELFTNTSEVDAPLIITGDAIKGKTPEDAVLANYIKDTIAETRKDCVAFFSPAKESVVSNKGREARSVIEDRNLLGSTSYAVLDSGWKYMYDRYNDAFRWVPLNGDHAGCYARNDYNNEVWTSAAGTSKGRLKNVTKLAWNPNKDERDELYLNDINPVMIMPVAGPVIFGDKTLLGKNTAFSRINVRRLFITLEKSIATAAAELLFEFNDEFTQRKFVSMVEPFLRDVKGRRGITDFLVIADSTVNTPQVVQNNRFVGQIFIKPNYVINFIKLQFVAVNASASFEEVVGTV